MTPRSTTSSVPVELRDYPAPARLDPFLHVAGRRPDGYHLLQTVFQLIDWSDTPHFARRLDRRLVCTTSILGAPANDDPVIRAARLLQAETGYAHSVDTAIEERLPMGGNLGDDPSDAATMPLALNRLWDLDPSHAQLMKIGLKLGTDVPFFVLGQNAFAKEIGKKLTPITLPPAASVAIHPRMHVPTPATFLDERLTRDTPLTIITDFPDQKIVFTYGRNDLQAVAERKYGEIARALVWLYQLSPPARTTGSGACVLAPFDNVEHVQAVADRVSSEREGRCVAGLMHHLLARFAV